MIAQPDSDIPRASSVTHEHLLSVIHTETRDLPEGGTFRLLDAGCGNGRMTAYLVENLPKPNQSLNFDIFGFDVSDFGSQAEDFFSGTIHLLSTKFPEMDWKNKLALISVHDRWPYPDEYFDAIVSNQVLEHVKDLDLFFSEIHRTLRCGGFSVHLFPLIHCIYEGHLLLPWVHRIKHDGMLVAAIRFLSQLGLGKYKRYRRECGVTLDEFSRQHADYIHHLTHYIGYGEALQLAERHNMCVSTKYTQEFYVKKVAILGGMKPGFVYRRSRSSSMDRLAVFFLKYISSVTLFLQKNGR